MIQVLERFHKLLERLSEEPNNACALSDLAARIGTSPKTCANILKTMCDLGYARQTPGRKGYLLGYAPYRMTRKGPFMGRLGELAKPSMEKLATETGEMAALICEADGDRIEIARVEGSKSIRVVEGRTPPSYSCWETAAGIALLSYWREERLKRFWEAKGRFKNILGAKTLEEALARFRETRKAGIFVFAPEPKSEEEALNAVALIGVPVFENGEASASLGGTVPLFRFAAGRREAVVKAYRDAAKAIGDAMTGSEGRRA